MNKEDDGSMADGDADQDDTASTLNGDDGQQPDEEANIRIFLRVKPSRKPSGFFSWDEDSNTMKYDIPKDVAAGLINNSRTTYKFRFDSVIGMEARQEEVFDRVGRPCVDSALNGFNSTVFAYGQTGSGKTFTITGGAERYEDRGLIPRALSLIFERMKSNNQEQIIAQISYLEIYNNQGYDLLDPNHESTKSLEDLPRVAMLEDEDGNCHLRNLSMHPVTTEEDALNLLFLGDTNRAVSETAMNLASSRSHCIFTVSLETRKVGSEVVLRSKLHLVDLAGSERAHKTGAKGQLLREAAYINTSLHYLEMVIVALHEKNTKGRTHIPYRNSMMTSVLRDSLGGNCKTVMVATVSPEKDQTGESVSTCRFAQRVARVKNDARLNEEVDPAVIIRQLKAQVASLEEELAILKGDVNEGSELKDYEIDKLRQKCLNFVNDCEPSAHLSMGEFTYTKMKACFDILKSMANAAGEAAASAGGSAGPPVAPSGVKLISAGSGGNNQEMEQRVQELEQLVQQRDNEIAIMVNMIRKEHGAAVPAELLSRGFVDYTSNQDEHTDAKPHKKHSVPAKQPNDYASALVVDPAVLEDPAKAFEAFKAQYPKNDAIRDNKVALKRKYDTAKALANEVNDARNQIKALTVKIEKLRKQQAIADEGLLDAEGEDGDSGPNSAARAENEAAEQRLKEQIDTYKVAYKKGFNELSELKKEIQHIQKMLEMGRIKLQKDFDLWYQRQGKGALLTENLLAQAKPETTKSTGSKKQNYEAVAGPAKSASPERPESASRKVPWEAEGKAPNESKLRSSSQSQRSSAARQSTVEEDVSGFYEALDILKRRNNARKGFEAKSDRLKRSLLFISFSTFQCLQSKTSSKGTSAMLVNGVDISMLEGWMVKINSNPSFFGKNMNRRWFKVGFVPGPGSEKKLVISYSTSKTAKDPRGWLYVEDVSGIYCRREMIEIVSPSRTLRLKGETAVEHRLWSDSLYKLCNPPPKSASAVVKATPAPEPRQERAPRRDQRETKQVEDDEEDRAQRKRRSDRERDRERDRDGDRRSARNEDAERESRSARSNRQRDEDDDHENRRRGRDRDRSRGRSPREDTDERDTRKRRSPSPQYGEWEDDRREEQEPSRRSPPRHEREEESRNREPVSHHSDDDSSEDERAESPRPSTGNSSSRSLLVAQIKAGSSYEVDTAQSKNVISDSEEEDDEDYHREKKDDGPEKESPREPVTSSTNALDDEPTRDEIESVNPRSLERLAIAEPPSKRKNSEYFDSDDEEHEQETFSPAASNSVDTRDDRKAPVSSVASDNNFIHDDWDADEEEPASPATTTKTSHPSAAVSGGVAADSNFVHDDWDD
ncbi:hypothetical protein PRIC1_012844 [Phytophthora ramorum]